MSLWDIFKSEPISNKELLSEFDALCYRILVEQIPYTDSMNRYERLLKEIYLRGLKPNQTLTPKKEKEKK